MRTVLLALVLLAAACSKNEAQPAPTTTTTSGDLTVGKTAPDFSAKAHDGLDVKISAMKGKPVVLYFYPKDETPGCTKEACSFRDAWKELEKTGVVLVGISTDTLDAHKDFAKHYDLPFHLISDPDGAIAKSYGVGKTFGMLDRQTIVVGADGNVKKIYRAVDVTKHANEVLADLKS